MADFYFGNLATGLQKRPAPETGMDASSVGSSESMAFDNGGAYVSQSAGTHREFDLSWGVQEKSVMNWLNEYRNGAYGTGLLYMVDPFATNVMPPHWANPGLTCEGWPSLVGPSVKPTRAAASTITNLATNPSFEAAGASVAVRTNYIANPSFEGGTGAPWNAYQLGTGGTAAISTATAYTGTTSLRVATGTGAAPYAGVSWDTPNLPVGTYTLSAWVRLSTVFGTGIQARVIDPSGVQTFGIVNAVLNEWQRVTWTYTTTVAGIHKLFFVTNGNAPASGSVFYIDAILLEASPTADSYFDGSTPAAGDFTYAWSGTANASASVQQGVGVAGLTASYDNASWVIRSSEWSSSGAHSVRIIPRGQVGSYLYLSAGQLGLTVGKTYTAVTTQRQSALQEADGHPIFARAFAWGEGGSYPTKAVGPNEVGSRTLRITFTVIGANNLLLLGNGSRTESMWYDNLLIVEGNYTGPYFDGSTEFIDGTKGAWTGATNASTSTLARIPGGMPNTGALYPVTGNVGAVPPRKLTLMIPADRDLYLGFTGVASSGAALRMQTITREGAYGPVQDLTLLDPAGNTRLNTKVSGGAYRAVQVYMTSTAPGASTINLVSSKAVYSLSNVTPDLTGGHMEGEGHTGFRFNGAPTTTYVQAANGRKLVSTAANFTEIEAWL